MRHWPRLSVTYRWLDSEGDQRSDIPLADVGGKALFARTIEKALLNGEADLAVHSLKDLPAQDTPGLRIAATPTRADVRDAMIARNAQSIDDPPQNATIGSASPRRTCQLRRLRSDLQFKLIRGNLETRIARVTEHQQFDATVLAMAGLTRLEMTEHVSFTFSLDQMLPAAGQGAIAVQCRADDHRSLGHVMVVNDPATAQAVSVERQVVAALGCNCHSPVAAYAQIADGHIRLRVRVFSLRQDICLEADERETFKRAGRLAQRVADDLKSRGSDTLLAEA